MYEVLVKTLRCCGSDDRCKGCPREHGKGKCYDDICIEAADAIEALEILNALNKRNKDLAIKLAETRKAIIDKLMGKPKWIPVTERLPEEEVTVLVVRKFLGIKDCPAKTYVETAEYCCGDWVADSDEYKIARSRHTDPLYWMPLPEPPKGE